VTEPAILRVPVQSRSQKTRALLLKAARRDFAERGYAATTSKSIAERAGVGTGTFYHYFPDKDAALREICRERTHYLAGEAEHIASHAIPLGDGPSVAEDAESRLRQVVLLCLEYHRHDPGLHAVIEERRAADSHVDAIMKKSERVAIARFEGALSVYGYEGDREAIAFMMFALLEGAVHSHVLSHPVVSDERFIDALTEAMLRIALPRSFAGVRLPESVSNQNR
jgi:AcrR family transcriptional regulator